MTEKLAELFDEQPKSFARSASIVLKAPQTPTKRVVTA